MTDLQERSAPAGPTVTEFVCNGSTVRVGDHPHLLAALREELGLVAIDAGAEDVIANGDGSLEVITSAEEFGDVRDGIAAGGLEPAQAEVTMRSSTNVALDAENARQIFRLLEMLEDLDDVQQVYSNVEISDEILAEFG